MLFNIIAILITITAIFSFLNVRHFGLPSTIGVLAISLVFSALVIVVGKVGIPLDTAATGFLRRIDFNRVLLHGRLAYLLFAGGLNLKISQLSDQKGAIALLSTLGVAISTRHEAEGQDHASVEARHAQPRAGRAHGGRAVASYRVHEPGRQFWLPMGSRYRIRQRSNAGWPLIRAFTFTSLRPALLGLIWSNAGSL